MTITAGDFVAAFPEFGNSQTYPVSQINLWIPAAYQQLNARRFGETLDLAAMLFVAHNLTLSAREARAAVIPGAVVGTATGPVSSKGVGPVSVGYDTAATTIKDAGAWNSTSYGQRLYTMMRAYGLGPVYRPARGRVFCPPFR